LNIFDSLNIRS